MKSQHIDVYRFHQALPDGWRFYYTTEKAKDKWILDGVGFSTPPRPNEAGNVLPVFRYYYEAKKGEIRYRYSTENQLIGD